MTFEFALRSRFHDIEERLLELERDRDRLLKLEEIVLDLAPKYSECLGDSCTDYEEYSLSDDAEEPGSDELIDLSEVV